jgi:archaellum component FlaC
MAEANGNSHSRLDRMERMLDLVIQDRAQAASDQRRADERMDLSDKRMERVETRMERISEIMALMANDHIAFRDEHKRLLTAQVVLDDRMKELAEAQKVTEHALTDLIKIVDGIIRARPPQ